MAITPAPTEPQVATVPSLEYAIGVIRVSERGKRDDEHFKSPDEQKLKIQDALRPMKIELAGTRNEIDVKGRWPLKRRKGLTWAIEQIEAGYAKVLVVAYFDRLCRSIQIKSEVVLRVEAAGGRVLALDFGEVTEKTAVQWFSSTMVAAVAEYLSRSVGERLAGTQKMSIDAGVPIGTVPPGYRKDDDPTSPTYRRIVLHTAEAAVMSEAFRLRADGASWRAVRKHMADGGIVRTVGSVRKLLHSRTYLGELFFGKLRKTGSHAAIIDVATFERVVGKKGKAYGVPGRKSQLLLSSTRVLRCGTCKKALQAASQVQGGKSYPVYKCNPNLVCARRVSIDARIADEAVASYVRQKLADESATEGPGMELIQAQDAAEAAQAAYSRAMRNLADSSDEPEAQTILAEKRAARDAASAYAAELERRARSIGNAVTLNAAADWDTLDLAERRDLITSVLERVEVAPGSRHFRGAGRLHFVDHLSEALG
jgi:DNA invertase Pin-like site-specific DNA recombinase